MQMVAYVTKFFPFFFHFLSTLPFREEVIFQQRLSVKGDDVLNISQQLHPVMERLRQEASDSVLTEERGNLFPPLLLFVLK